MSEEKTTYKTSDIYFSAFLCAQDITLDKTEIDTSGGKKKVVFVFILPPEELQKMKSGFFGGSGVVKAQKFVQQLRSLKSMCFI